MPTLHLLKAMAGLSVPYQFPFCVDTTKSSLSSANQLYYPIELTLDEIFEWAYRWRKLQYNVTGGVCVGPTNTADISGIFNGSDRPAISSEISFACTLGDWVEGPSETFSDASAEFTLALFQELPGLPAIVSNDDYTAFYPSISISWLLQTDYEGEEASIEGSSLLEDPLPTSSITLGGFEILVPYVEAGDTSNITNISSVVISPLEWYAYNPGSGGDIWDTATGAELRDPFSVQTWN